MKTKRKIPRKKRKNLARNVPPFSVEFRIKAARLHVEDGYPAALIAEPFGISEYSVYRRWGWRYRKFGQQGLLYRPRDKTGSRTPAAVHQNIINLKTENPTRGGKRISDILKRFFMVGASPSTVQRTLKSEGLTKPAKKKRKKNPAKPRFFERATPNQMWQSDIMTFRLAGKKCLSDRLYGRL